MSGEKGENNESRRKEKHVRKERGEKNESIKKEKERRMRAEGKRKREEWKQKEKKEREVMEDKEKRDSKQGKFRRKNSLGSEDKRVEQRKISELKEWNIEDTQLYLLAENQDPPCIPPHLGSIQGRHWSAKIDDISLCPL